MFYLLGNTLLNWTDHLLFHEYKRHSFINGFFSCIGTNKRNQSIAFIEFSADFTDIFFVWSVVTSEIMIC